MLAFIHWNDGVSQGVFALLGVLVGGLVTAGTTLYVERRRERREVRATARRLHTAFNDFHYQVACGEIAEQEEGKSLGRYWYYNKAKPSLDLWSQFEEPFARNLRRRQWAAVSMSVEGIKTIAFPPESYDPSAIDPRIRQFELEEAHENLDYGTYVLSKLADVRRSSIRAELNDWLRRIRRRDR